MSPGHTMEASRAMRHLRLALILAALGLLAALFLLHAPQTRADTTQPAQAGWHVNGSSLVIIFNELLDETSVPAAAAFTVNIGGTDYTPASVVVRGAEVKLTLSTAAAMGDTVTWAYNRGMTTNRIQDLAGNQAAEQLDARTTENYTGSTNRLPAFSMDEVTLTVDENTASGMNVGSAVAATDDDGDTLIYEFQMMGFSAFTVDGSSGQVKTSAALDFESGTTTYVAVLYVRDNKGPSGGGSSLKDDSIKVTINVNDVNEAPTIAGDAAHNVDENTTTVGTYTVTDPDPADTHTWSIEGDTTTEGNRDGSLFQIGQTSGELSFMNAPDYETPGSMAATPDNAYKVTIKATDNGSPAMSNTYDVSVNVRDVNEPPSITTMGQEHISISKPEGTSTSDNPRHLHGGRPGERLPCVDAERRRRGGLRYQLVRRAYVQGCSRLRKPGR